MDSEKNLNQITKHQFGWGWSYTTHKTSQEADDKFLDNVVFSLEHSQSFHIWFE